MSASPWRSVVRAFSPSSAELNERASNSAARRHRSARRRARHDPSGAVGVVQGELPEAGAVHHHICSAFGPPPHRAQVEQRAENTVFAPLGGGKIAACRSWSRGSVAGLRPAANFEGKRRRRSPRPPPRFVAADTLLHRARSAELAPLSISRQQRRACTHASAGRSTTWRRNDVATIPTPAAPSSAGVNAACTCTPDR